MWGPARSARRRALPDVSGKLPSFRVRKRVGSAKQLACPSLLRAVCAPRQTLQMQTAKFNTTSSFNIKLSPEHKGGASPRSPRGSYATGNGSQPFQHTHKHSTSASFGRTNSQTAHLSSYKIFHKEDFFNVSSSDINVPPDYYKVPRGTSIDMPPLLILVATMGICKTSQ